MSHEKLDAYAALRVPDYRRLLIGAVLASTGAEIQAVAIGWELYLRTESAWMLGLVGLAQFLPVLLLALPAGQAADHFSRKKVFQGALALSALVSASLAWLSEWQGPVELVFLLLLLAGVARAFSAPARTALLPQVVPAELLPNAVTWNSSGWQIANVSGPALGGLLVAYASPATAYCFAAGLAVVCSLLLIPVRPKITFRPTSTRSVANLLAGVRFVWHTNLMLAAITLDLFAVLLGGAVALLPIYARDILEVGPVGLGWLRAAPAVGAFLMAVALAHLPPLQRPGLALLLAVAGFGVATIVFGLSEDFWLSLAMLGLVGASDNISVVIRGTLMQVLTPDEMRGRVAAVNTVFISSSNELGSFESGVAAELFGAVLAVVAGGVGTLLVVLLAAWSWPELLRLGPLHNLRPAPVSEAEKPVQQA